MEKKLDFFSGLKDEVVRGLSLSRSRSNSPVRARSPMANLFRKTKTTTTTMAPIRGSIGVLDREIWECQAYRGSVSATHGRFGFGWRGSRGLEEGWVGARTMG
ncbi:hypothetical protein V6N13_131989 [Hibiscus sabdariffa]|uniref:Uncharacterized protein n=1 Tax=Hibiscus sabdariffa TaxID=183260 RepID=A0ABR2NIG7_9ROSI